MAPIAQSVHRGDVSAPFPRAQIRRASARRRRQRFDQWLSISALVAALLALPLAQSTWHGPEVAAVLAVSATALFAGQRWGLAVIVIAELFLLPTVWPRALLSSEIAPRIVAIVTLLAIAPGMLAMRRAAAGLVIMSGLRRTQQMCRRVHTGMVAITVMAMVVPLL